MQSGGVDPMACPPGSTDGLCVCAVAVACGVVWRDVGVSQGLELSTGQEDGVAGRAGHVKSDLLSSCGLSQPWPSLLAAACGGLRPYMHRGLESSWHVPSVDAVAAQQDLPACLRCLRHLYVLWMGHQLQLCFFVIIELLLPTVYVPPAPPRVFVTNMAGSLGIAREKPCKVSSASDAQCTAWYSNCNEPLPYAPCTCLRGRAEFVWQCSQPCQLWIALKSACSPAVTALP